MIAGVRGVLSRTTAYRARGLLRGFADSNPTSSPNKFLTASQVEADPALKTLFDKELEGWTRNFFELRQQ